MIDFLAWTNFWGNVIFHKYKMCDKLYSSETTKICIFSQNICYLENVTIILYCILRSKYIYLNNFFLISLVRNLTDGFLARPLSGLGFLVAVLVPSNRSIYFSRWYSSLALAHSSALRLTNEPKMEKIVI